ncbi:fatty acyl-CoA reductase wat [Dendroctonus ponderosae]|uniref:Fatty acyl-CoA reductase n=1 Tax=Dendroctonus ponderosae TaxID=77166 RepID=J3JWZ4_DENPD
MEGATVELTEIQQFYRNETVFLTGATGFLGKLMLEKVLRALPVKKVFLLIRTKKNVAPSARLQAIFESPIFDGIKRDQRTVFDKIEIIQGDCELPMLGISAADLQRMQEEVTVIFHFAATVRFHEHIKKATWLNVRATKDLVGIAKQLRRIKTFVYVGTAFSNSNRKEIEEQIYPSRISAENLIAVCQSLDDATLSCMSSKLTADWPNNYTFTKQVAEEYIGRAAQDIPICICRPSIVVSTAAEPIEAFIDSPVSMGGLSVMFGLGICRIFYYKKIILDVVPADYVVNECIAAGWHTGEMFRDTRAKIPVYHICSSIENPVSLEDLWEHGQVQSRANASLKAVMYPMYFVTTCKPNYLFWKFVLETMVAHITDLMLKMRGQKPMLVSVMRKLHAVQESLEHFTCNAFHWHVENHFKLQKKMSFKDRELFNFNIKALDWHTYFSQQAKGVRVYLIKDPFTTLPEGFKRMRRLRKIFIVVLLVSAIVLYGLGKLLFFRLLPLVFAFIAYCLRCLVC